MKISQMVRGGNEFTLDEALSSNPTIKLERRKTETVINMQFWSGDEWWMTATLSPQEMLDLGCALINGANLLFKEV